MKVIIEIPEEVLNTRYYTDYFGCGSHKLTETLDNGTPIPDNATNGDVIKAMFGKEFADKCIDYCNAHMVGGDWWNAPYQIGIYFTDYRQR